MLLNTLRLPEPVSAGVATTAEKTTQRGTLQSLPTRVMHRSDGCKVCLVASRTWGNELERVSEDI